MGRQADLVASPALSKIDIAICTFRRAHIAATLESVGALEVPPGIEVRVIVADNDSVDSARDLVERTAADLAFPVRYLHCPAANISIARNACLDAVSGDFCAFIDDDEIAAPNWLAALLAKAAEPGRPADVVLGPVRATYAPDLRPWLRRGDFHSTMPIFVKGEIVTGYTCNVLIRLNSPAVEGVRFALHRGLTGGEDTDFFAALYARGARIVYAPEAVVFEPVMPSRARFGWLAARRFRSGQTHGHLLRAKRRGLSLLTDVALASLKALYCFLGALIAAPFVIASRRSALRGVFHVGAVCGLFGMREIVQYGMAQPREDKAGEA